jgi:hypothetical protein
MEETKDDAYKPGSCNIGKSEVRRRFRIGFTGLALMILLILFIHWFHLPSVARLGLFIPAFYAVSGFIQAFMKFCYIYGWKGIMSLTGRKKFEKVNEPEYVRKDRRKATLLVLIVTCSAMLLTLIYFFLDI